MKKRILSACVYVVILAGFFLIKLLVSPAWFPQLGMLLFDLMVVLFSVIGTYEMTRAFGDQLTRLQKIIITIFSTGSILCYSISDAVFQYLRMTDKTITNYSPNFAFVVFGGGVAFLFSLLVFEYSKVDLQSFGKSLIAYLYPSAFLLVLSGVNHMPNVDYSKVGILYAFIICPAADTFAFFFGKLLGKKVPMKMAPNISPNKTMIGGLGGLIGGGIGAVVIYFIYYGILGRIDTEWTNMVFFVGLGILTAAFAQFGDLVESSVKRRLDVKDMGNIMPGHGGILDRIDSMLYASLIICLVFVLRIMTTG